MIIKRLTLGLLTAAALATVSPAFASGPLTSPYHQVPPPSADGPLPAQYHFRTYWPMPRMYDQEQTPRCTDFSTATAISALAEVNSGLGLAAPRDVRFSWGTVTSWPIGVDNVLRTLTKHPATDTRGQRWGVTSSTDAWQQGLVNWHNGQFQLRKDGSSILDWNIDGVKRMLLKYHVLVADLMLTKKFEGDLNSKVIGLGGKWDVADTGHSIAVIGWNRYGFVLQSTWGDMGLSHWHSLYVVSWRYWEHYAMNVHGFTITRE